MRESVWTVTWEPEGETPLVLLASGDLMDSEMRLPAQQLVSSGRSDFALRATAIARRNVKQRLEFSRRLPAASPVAAWQACLAKLKGAPWGLKGTLRIAGAGESRDFTAALLSTRHRPSFQDGIAESFHEYAFRVA